MGDDGPGPNTDNPYAVPAGQPAGQPPARPGPPRPAPQPREEQLAVLRRARRAGLLGALAAIAAVALPPAGLIIGGIAIVLGAKLAAPLRSSGVTVAGAVLPIASGAFAVVVGALLTTLVVIAAPELIDFRECMSGANTQLAEQACEQQFSHGLSERFLAG